jgi:hypothetical protein
MDSLDDLPVTPTVLTPKEEASMQRLFQKGSLAAASHASSNIKLALGCLIGIFILLVNPWTTGVIETIPKCSSNVAQLAVKTLVFFIVAFIVLRWIM